MKDHPVKKVGHGEHTSVLKIADDVESKIEQAGSVTVNELCAYIETALSQLGDAHTTAYTRFNEPLFLRHYAKWQTGSWKIKAINGFTIKEVIRYVSLELIVSSIIGIIIGLALGSALSYRMIRLLESIVVHFDRGIQFKAWIIAALFTVFFTSVISAWALRKVKTLRLTDIVDA